MNVLYQIFFGALSLLLLVWLADTVRSISSQPVWARVRQDDTTFAPKSTVTTTTATIEAAKAIALARSAAVKPGQAPVREKEKEEEAVATA